MHVLLYVVCAKLLLICCRPHPWGTLSSQQPLQDLEVVIQDMRLNFAILEGPLWQEPYLSRATCLQLHKFPLGVGPQLPARLLPYLRCVVNVS